MTGKSLGEKVNCQAGMLECLSFIKNLLEFFLYFWTRHLSWKNMTTMLGSYNNDCKNMAMIMSCFVVVMIGSHI